MSEKKHYLIYQITNNINGKIYIGKHETFNIDDDYFGSGKYLRHAQEKYGLKNFTKTILFELQNEEEMNLLEKMVVTEEFCKRDDVYNLNVGGDGGWSYNNSNNHRVLIQDQKNIDIQLRQFKCGQSMKQKIRNMSEDEYFQYCQKITNGLKMHKLNHPEWMTGENNPMYQHEYSQETLDKMSKSHLGEKNHMSNKMWICNDETHESKSILKTDPIPNGWRKGRICKK